MPDGCAIVKNARHLENAQLFLDFISGEDVQQRMEAEFSRRPVRTVSQEAEILLPLSDIPLLDYDISWASEHHNGILMSWAFYFGGEEQP